jgi:mRNA interferase MazF
MKRGEIWTLAGGPDYAGKPRPCVVLQSDVFTETASLTICTVTSDPTAATFRIPVQPSPLNGLEKPSQLMADKVTTVPKAKLGRMIGRLDQNDLQQLGQAVLVFLGLADGGPKRNEASQ